MQGVIRVGECGGIDQWHQSVALGVSLIVSSVRHYGVASWRNTCYVTQKSPASLRLPTALHCLATHLPSVEHLVPFKDDVGITIVSVLDKLETRSV